ncbi:hypothetical protein E8E13_003781 [Curvularia kusanoi]|uniref:Heterokaryon incompatibility domain-containing protein n=1 Tax=Curvularia kusanoi TaxID=90978 RepID=A0A9P4W6Y4_CURKU|nr:hypothetical protein E8E13_003781 [Curvularia kusanoi]
MEHLRLLKLSDKFKTECFENKYVPSLFRTFTATAGNKVDESSGEATKNDHVPSPFQEFPGKFGYEIDELTGKITRKLEFCGNPLPFEHFVQSWLFYGLITAVVYDDNSNKDRHFDASQFENSLAPGNLGTEHLEKILKDWQSWEIRQKAERDMKQKMRMIHAQLALDLAKKVVQELRQKDSDSSGSSSNNDVMEVDSKLALTLMVIGETLSNAKARISKKIGLEIYGWSGDPNIGWGTPKVVIAKMMSEGWCPRTVKLLKTQLPRNATALLSAYALHDDNHFRGQHKPPKENRDGCTEERCISKSKHPKSKGEYATKHHPDCAHSGVTCWPSSSTTVTGDSPNPYCGRRENEIASPGWDEAAKITCVSPCSKMLGPPMDEVVDVIMNEKIPLLRFKENTENGLVLEVTEFTRDTEYATISHVWSDGYGNSQSNELYRCQIDYLYRLLREAQKHRTRNRRGPKRQIAFWMDTLIVPVEKRYKEARKFAIHQIYEVFDKAQYTIVIDNGLNRMEWDHKDYTSTAMKILASGWMRRLWTLQEAFVSRKLMFAFKGGYYTKLPLIDLDDIEDLYDDSDDGLSLNLQTIARTYYRNMLGPNRRERLYKNVTSHGMSLVADVWRAAQWRTMEHEENETLALATLLNLDIKRTKSLGSAELYAGNDIKKSRMLDEKMKEFWLLLEKSSPGAIPSGIIFLAGKRISLPGFGWAPRSWMSALEQDYPDPIATATHPARLLADEGLEVHYPGFWLHCETDKAILPITDGKGFWFPCDSSMTEIYHVTRPDFTEHKTRRGAQPDNRDLAIILCRARPGQIAEIALLVRVDEIREERLLGQDSVRRVIAADILFRVKIKREAANETLKYQRERFFRKHKPNHTSTIVYGECLDTNQKWCVDCRTFEEEIPDATLVESAENKPPKPDSSGLQGPLLEWSGDPDESSHHTQNIANSVGGASTNGSGSADSDQAGNSLKTSLTSKITRQSSSEDDKIEQSPRMANMDTHKPTQADKPGRIGEKSWADRLRAKFR